jgi:hypothetical protein
MDNSQISRELHAPVSIVKPSSSQDEPGSMTRSRSVRANANGLEPKQDEGPRYLPKGDNRSHNGVIMPTRPYGAGGLPLPSTGGGVESPQWGWYINTTPPTPDTYHSGSRSLHKKQDSLANASESSSSTAATESSTATSQQPNRIFQDLQGKRKGAAMGWSSVPL